MKKWVTVLGLVLLFMSHQSTAQISITSNTLTGWVGFTQTIHTDTSGSVTIEVGEAGPNQTWDFTNLPSDGFSIVQEMKTAASTPYAGQFPSANYAFITQFPSSPEFGSIYNYVNISSSQVLSVGDVMVADGTIIDSEKDGTQITPLPITYGETWTSTTSDTFALPGLGATITTLTETYTVDAWGTIKLPSGEYQCLRWKNEGVAEQKSVVAGVEVPISSFTYIDYQWIGLNSLYLASASSMENETDPDFNTASEVSWLASVSGSTDITQRVANVPEEFEVFANYPNPFNPSTRMSFQLPQQEFVTLRIFDINGRIVRTLVSQPLSAGMHEFTWNGTNAQGELVAGGTYFYQVVAGESRIMKKMTFLK